jgi:hypothetical protein
LYSCLKSNTPNTENSIDKFIAKSQQSDKISIL